MTELRPAFFKTLHVVGDSHALAFKGKSVVLPEYNAVGTTNVCYVRGLSALNVATENKLHPELVNYLLQQNLITKEGRDIALTSDPATIAEQYAVGRGFEKQIVVFLAGEIYVRKFLGSIYSEPKPDFAAIKARFMEVVRKYVADVKGVSGLLNCSSIVHALNPPTANDESFERINNFRCSRQLRGQIYHLYNQALIETAAANGLAFFATPELMDETGCLKDEYEFDGVHADPRYAYDSLKKALEIWLSSRGAEQSNRYHRWAQLLGPRAEAPIAKQPVTNMGIYFSREQVANLRESLGTFKPAVCERPLPDWAHIPLKKGYRKYNEVVQYAPVSADGLKILHDALLTGDAAQTLRAQLGSHFSLINCRAVKSLQHQNDGVGQQFYHRDGCPPGIFRGLIYLVDVDDTLGPFEYLADPNSQQSTRVPGAAGSVLIFDANAVMHRAAPPRSDERYAIDLVLLLHPESCAPVVHSYPFCTWPVDPYLFEYVGNSYPAAKSGRWFHPTLVMPPKTTAALKTLSSAEMAVGGAA